MICYVNRGAQTMYGLIIKATRQFDIPVTVHYWVKAAEVDKSLYPRQFAGRLWLRLTLILYCIRRV